MSSSPNCFTVESQTEEGRIATHIRFDPITPHPKLKFQVDVSGENQGSDSRHNLLTNVLGLILPTVQPEPMKQQKVKFVEAKALRATIRASDGRSSLHEGPAFKFSFDMDSFGQGGGIFDF
jgi:hypothetical protein